MSTLDFIVCTARIVLYKYTYILLLPYTTTEMTEGIPTMVLAFTPLKVFVFFFSRVFIFIRPFDICISNLVDEVDVLFSVHEKSRFD